MGASASLTLKLGAACHRALHEQLRRRERLDGAAVRSRLVGRTGERIQSVDVLTFDPECLAACRQDVDLRRGPMILRRQRGNRFDEMFAGVEDQKNSLARANRRSGSGVASSD